MLCWFIGGYLARKTVAVSGVAVRYQSLALLKKSNVVLSRNVFITELADYVV